MAVGMIVEEVEAVVEVAVEEVPPATIAARAATLPVNARSHVGMIVEAVEVTETEAIEVAVDVVETEMEVVAASATTVEAMDISLGSAMRAATVEVAVAEAEMIATTDGMTAVVETETVEAVVDATTVEAPAISLATAQSRAAVEAGIVVAITARRPAISAETAPRALVRQWRTPLKTLSSGLNH